MNGKRRFLRWQKEELYRYLLRGLEGNKINNPKYDKYDKYGKYGKYGKHDNNNNTCHETFVLQDIILITGVETIRIFN